MKRWGRLALGLMLVGLAAWYGVGCGKATDPWENETGSPRIVVTIPPLVSVVRGVAGDRPAIKCLCLVHGPHDYNLGTRDVRLLNKADLFLAIGLSLDDNFADGMRVQARRPDLPYLKLGDKLPESSLLEFQHVCTPAEGEAPHEHGKWDPHIWLGIEEMIAMTEMVRDQLCSMDPEHASEYRENAKNYIARLTALHQYGKEKLADKKVRRIISFHEAFGYFARSFGLEVAGVIEVGPGDEPSAKHLADIVKLCQDEKNPIGAITHEPQYKMTSAQVVSRRLNNRVPLVLIDPLETADPDELQREGAMWYETRMRKNLDELASKLR